MNASRPKVLHIISDLGQGGAEMVLASLVAATSDTHEHAVVSLHSEGVLAGQLRRDGVTVECLQMPRGSFSLSAFRRLIAVIKSASPDVVQTRMYHANLVGTLAVMRAVPVPVVWAVHATYLGNWRINWKTALVRFACVPLSYLNPSWIVFDSECSRQLHGNIGFRRSVCRVIDNGVDTARFAPDIQQRQQVRDELGVQRDEILVGCVARWDPLKDHENLFAALRDLRAQSLDFRCLLVGRGLDAGNAALVRSLRQHGLSEVVMLAGARSDIPAVMNALDVHVLASKSESAPVTVVEAMACGTPCVATDVGDCARMIGATGWIAPPRDPRSLAHVLGEAIRELRGSSATTRSAACRQHAVEHFGLQAMAVQYRLLWDSIT